MYLFWYCHILNALCFAGAGLVKGSTVDEEMQEVALKFEVLRNQLNLDNINCSNDL